MPIQTQYLNSGKTQKWVDISNPTGEELRKVAKDHHIQQRAVVDCMDPDHLPKHESIGDFTFLIIRMFNGNMKAHLDSIRELTCKIAVFYNNDTVITVHRLKTPVFDLIKNQKTEWESSRNEDIVVTILHMALASFEEPAVVLGEQVENYESTVLLKHTKPALLQGLYYLKRKSSSCKKVLLLSDDLINYFRSTETDLSLLQDVYDLYAKLITLYDQVLDDITNLLNIYLSLTSQKTNDVMKVLTIFSVFFMPLTFIVGVYGMNFRYMPELNYRWAYPAVWCIMIALTVIIYFWFKKKKWL